MAAPNERFVRCYHCERDILVPAAARTASCPVCFKGLVLDDLAVKDVGGYPGRLVTCGKVYIHSHTHTVIRNVMAGAGVDIAGVLAAKVSTFGCVKLSPSARVKGDCEARSLVVEEGAVIEGGFYRIGIKVPSAGAAGPVRK
jgi:hypothetical protein